MNIKLLIETVLANAKDHESDLMIGAGVAGFVMAIGATAFFAPKVSKKIEVKKKELKVEKLPFKEVVKAGWKETAIISGVAAASGFCILKAHSNDISDLATATAAATIAENSLKDYKSQAKKILGEEKEKDIQKKADEERKKKNEVRAKTADVAIDGSKLYLFRDLWYGNEFYCTKSILEEAMRKFKNQLSGEMYCVVEEFYDYIREAFPRTINPDAHKCEGWNADESADLNIDYYEPIWSVTNPNEIVIQFAYTIQPRRDYRERY